MSDTVDRAFVKSFENAITIEPQQEEARIWNRCQMKTVEAGEQAYFERIGTVAATKQVGRHAPTRQFNTPHTRRVVDLFTYDHADFIDRADLRRMIVNPQSSYVQTFRYAFNQAKDDEVIAAFTATAKVGKTGSDTAAFDTDFQIDNSTGMTTAMVLEANEILDAAEQRRDNRYMAASARQRRDLLTEEASTATQFAPAASADFGDARALSVGTITMYGNFEWVPSERLDVNATPSRSCIAWQKNAMGCAQLLDFFVDIGPRRDLQLTQQIYAEMDIGSTRVDETGVVELICDE